MLFAYGLPGLILIGGFLIWMCIHVVRSGQQIFWIWIILVVFPPIGALVYFFAIVLPEIIRGPAARKMGRAARDTLDPTRSYRDARAAHDLAPTVHNQMRLAAAAAELGRHDEAEALYARAAQGVHADDPALLLGRAKALVELGRPAEALALLQQLGAQGKEGETPQAVLTFARAYEGLGRDDEAARSYDWAAPRL
ncbi:MAG TPA: tetratricopeptide repeat protein, partial [Caulobacteraceae bacterium]|nr:tetratricopeptide repeat protein [Caulobacteraceae bacterium]